MKATEKQKEYMREYLKKNKVRILAEKKKYYQANKHIFKESQRKNRYNRYGLTPSIVEAIIADQNNKCSICLGDFDLYYRKNACVDHCHKTGIIRGLICRDCNSLLGYAKDNTAILLSAINYLHAERNKKFMEYVQILQGAKKIE